MMEALNSSDTSVLTIAIRRNISEDTVLLRPLVSVVATGMRVPARNSEILLQSFISLQGVAGAT
jgi:hypothetical protein